MPENGGIQLLPESRKEIEVKIPGENRLLFLGFSAVVLVLVLFFGLRFYSSSFQKKIDALDAQLKSLDGKREIGVEEKILLIKDQFTTVGQILDNHIVWSHLLGKVQAKTAPQIQFKTMKLSFEDSKVEIESEALSYTVIARQIASYLSEEIIKDIRLSEVKLLPSGRLNVSMRLVFDKEKVLLKTIGK